MTHLLDWLELLFRWSHMIVGIAWIGASFYFNWLENRLEREHQADSTLEGDLWAIHGGGFYHVVKLKNAPPTLPPQLHWFKWEAYATWFTGIALLALMYYWDARLYLLDVSKLDLSPVAGSAIGIITLIISWLFYDLICKSPLSKRQGLLAAIVFIYLSLLAIVLCQIFSGRGAYIHVGSAIGTIMVFNVMAVIIPSQKALVDSVTKGEVPDPQLGAAALTRSRHNNYLTLPVLLIMISNHYPSTFGHTWNWAVLIALGVVGVLIRHYFNVRHLPGRKMWLAVAAGSGFVIIAILTIPQLGSGRAQLENIEFAQVRQIILERCTVCHSRSPVQPGFQASPGGLMMDTDDEIINLAHRIQIAVAASRSMPLGNVTQMTEDERKLIDAWYRTLLSGSKN